MILNQYKTFLKTVSGITLLCFVATNSAWGMPEAGLTIVPQRETPSFLQIEIPHDLATVQEVYEAPAKVEPKLILHIQNVHGNYESQVQIKKILEYLYQKYGFKLLFAEGAAEKLNPDLLRFFPDKERNLKLADLMAKKGELTGLEYYLIDGPADVQGVGIEQAGLYRQNYEAFKKVYGAKEQTDRFLEDYEGKLELLASRIFPQNTRRLLSEWKKFEAGQRDFLPYIKRLSVDAKSVLGIDLESLFSQIEWPQITRLLALQSMEKDLDKAAAAKEKERLIVFLKNQHAAPEIIDAIQKLDEKRITMERLNAADKKLEDLPRYLLERLVGEMGPKGFRFHEYPAFSLWAGYLILQNELDSRLLFEEIEKVFTKTLDQLSVSEREKNLLELYRDEILLRKLFHLELTRKEWERAVYRKDWIALNAMTDRLKKISSDITVVLRQSGESRKMDASFGMSFSESLSQTLQDAYSFYDFARKRESVFFDTIKNEMAAQHAEKAVLVTGGFHTDGLMEMFREQEINCGVLMPRLTGEIDNSNYISTMLETKPTMFDVGTMEGINSAQRAEVRVAQGAHLGKITAYMAGDLAEINKSDPRSEIRQVGKKWDLVVNVIDRSGQNPKLIVGFKPTTTHLNENAAGSRTSGVRVTTSADQVDTRRNITATIPSSQVRRAQPDRTAHVATRSEARGNIGARYNDPNDTHPRDEESASNSEALVTNLLEWLFRDAGTVLNKLGHREASEDWDMLGSLLGTRDAFVLRELSLHDKTKSGLALAEFHSQGDISDATGEALIRFLYDHGKLSPTPKSQVQFQSPPPNEAPPTIEIPRVLFDKAMRVIAVKSDGTKTQDVTDRLMGDRVWSATTLDKAYLAETLNRLGISPLENAVKEIRIQSLADEMFHGIFATVELITVTDLTGREVKFLQISANVNRIWGLNTARKYLEAHPDSKLFPRIGAQKSFRDLAIVTAEYVPDQRDKNNLAGAGYEERLRALFDLFQKGWVMNRASTDDIAVIDEGPDGILTTRVRIRTNSALSSASFVAGLSSLHTVKADEKDSEMVNLIADLFDEVRSSKAAQLEVISVAKSYTTLELVRTAIQQYRNSNPKEFLTRYPPPTDDEIAAIFRSETRSKAVKIGLVAVVAGAVGVAAWLLPRELGKQEEAAKLQEIAPQTAKEEPKKEEPKEEAIALGSLTLPEGGILHPKSSKLIGNLRRVNGTKFAEVQNRESAPAIVVHPGWGWGLWDMPPFELDTTPVLVVRYKSQGGQDKIVVLGELINTIDQSLVNETVVDGKPKFTISLEPDTNGKVETAVVDLAPHLITEGRAGQPPFFVTKRLALSRSVTSQPFDKGTVEISDISFMTKELPPDVQKTIFKDLYYAVAEKARTFGDKSVVQTLTLYEHDPATGLYKMHPLTFTEKGGRELKPPLVSKDGKYIIYENSNWELTVRRTSDGEQIYVLGNLAGARIEGNTFIYGFARQVRLNIDAAIDEAVEKAKAPRSEARRSIDELTQEAFDLFREDLKQHPEDPMGRLELLYQAIAAQLYYELLIREFGKRNRNIAGSRLPRSMTAFSEYKNYFEYPSLYPNYGTIERATAAYIPEKYPPFANILQWTMLVDDLATLIDAQNDAGIRGWMQTIEITPISFRTRNPDRLLSYAWRVSDKLEEAAIPDRSKRFFSKLDFSDGQRAIIDQIRSEARIGFKDLDPATKLVLMRKVEKEKKEIEVSWTQDGEDYVDKGEITMITNYGDPIDATIWMYKDDIEIGISIKTISDVNPPFEESVIQETRESAPWEILSQRITDPMKDVADNEIGNFIDKFGTDLIKNTIEALSMASSFWENSSNAIQSQILAKKDQLARILNSRSEARATGLVQKTKDVVKGLGLGLEPSELAQLESAANIAAVEKFVAEILPQKLSDALSPEPALDRLNALVLSLNTGLKLTAGERLTYPQVTGVVGTEPAAISNFLANFIVGHLAEAATRSEARKNRPRAKEEGIFNFRNIILVFIGGAIAVIAVAIIQPLLNQNPAPPQAQQPAAEQPKAGEAAPAPKISEEQRIGATTVTKDSEAVFLKADPMEHGNGLKHHVENGILEFEAGGGLWAGGQFLKSAYLSAGADYSHVTLWARISPDAAPDVTWGAFNLELAPYLSGKFEVEGITREWKQIRISIGPDTQKDQASGWFAISDPNAKIQISGLRFERSEARALLPSDIVADITRRLPAYEKVRNIDALPDRNITDPQFFITKGLNVRYGGPNQPMPSGTGFYGNSVVIFLEPIMEKGNLDYLQDQIRLTEAYRNGKIKFYPYDSIHYTLGNFSYHQTDPIPQIQVQKNIQRAREVVGTHKAFSLYLDGLSMDESGILVLQAFLGEGFEPLEEGFIQAGLRKRHYPRVDFNFAVIVAPLTEKEKTGLQKMLDRVAAYEIGLKQVSKVTFVHHQDDMLSNNLSIVDIRLEASSILPPAPSQHPDRINIYFGSANTLVDNNMPRQMLNSMRNQTDWEAQLLNHVDTLAKTRRLGFKVNFQEHLFRSEGNNLYITPKPRSVVTLRKNNDQVPLEVAQKVFRAIRAIWGVWDDEKAALGILADFLDEHEFTAAEIESYRNKEKLRSALELLKGSELVTADGEVKKDAAAVIRSSFDFRFPADVFLRDPVKDGAGVDYEKSELLNLRSEARTTEVNVLDLRERSRKQELLTRDSVGMLSSGKVTLRRTQTGQYIKIISKESTPMTFVNNQYSGVVFTSLSFAIPQEWAPGIKPLELDITLVDDSSNIFKVAVIQPKASFPMKYAIDLRGPSNVHSFVVRTNPEMLEKEVDIEVNEWPKELDRKIRTFQQRASDDMPNLPNDFLTGDAEKGITFSLPNVTLRIHSKSSLRSEVRTKEEESEPPLVGNLDQLLIALRRAKIISLKDVAAIKTDPEAFIAENARLERIQFAIRVAERGKGITITQSVAGHIQDFIPARKFLGLPKWAAALTLILGGAVASGAGAWWLGLFHKAPQGIAVEENPPAPVSGENSETAKQPEAAKNAGPSEAEEFKRAQKDIPSMAAYINNYLVKRGYEVANDEEQQKWLNGMAPWYVGQHDFKAFQSDLSREALSQLEAEGKIQKTGAAPKVEKPTPASAKTAAAPAQKVKTKQEEEKEFEAVRLDKKKFQQFLTDYLAKRGYRVEDPRWFVGFMPWYMNERPFHEFEAEIKNRSQEWLNKGDFSKIEIKTQEDQPQPQKPQKQQEKPKPVQAEEIQGEIKGNPLLDEHPLLAEAYRDTMTGLIALRAPNGMPYNQTPGAFVPQSGWIKSGDIGFLWITDILAAANHSRHPVGKLSEPAAATTRIKNSLQLLVKMLDRFELKSNKAGTGVLPEVLVYAGNDFKTETKGGRIAYASYDWGITLKYLRDVKRVFEGGVVPGLNDKEIVALADSILKKTDLRPFVDRQGRLHSQVFYNPTTSEIDLGPGVIDNQHTEARLFLFLLEFFGNPRDPYATRVEAGRKIWQGMKFDWIDFPAGDGTLPIGIGDSGLSAWTEYAFSLSRYAPHSLAVSHRNYFLIARSRGLEQGHKIFVSAPGTGKSPNQYAQFGLNDSSVIIPAGPFMALASGLPEAVENTETIIRLAQRARDSYAREWGLADAHDPANGRAFNGKRIFMNQALVAVGLNYPMVQAIEDANPAYDPAREIVKEFDRDHPAPEGEKEVAPEKPAKKAAAEEGEETDLIEKFSPAGTGALTKVDISTPAGRKYNDNVTKLNEREQSIEVRYHVDSGNDYAGFFAFLREPLDLSGLGKLIIEFEEEGTLPRTFKIELKDNKDVMLGGAIYTPEGLRPGQTVELDISAAAGSRRKVAQVVGVIENSKAGPNKTGSFNIKRMVFAPGKPAAAKKAVEPKKKMEAPAKKEKGTSKKQAAEPEEATLNLSEAQMGAFHVDKHTDANDGKESTVEDDVSKKKVVRFNYNVTGGGTVGVAFTPGQTGDRLRIKFRGKPDSVRVEVKRKVGNESMSVIKPVTVRVNSKWGAETVIDLKGKPFDEVVIAVDGSRLGKENREGELYIDGRIVNPKSRSEARTEKDIQDRMLNLLDRVVNAPEKDTVPGQAARELLKLAIEENRILELKELMRFEGIANNSLPYRRLKALEFILDKYQQYHFGKAYGAVEDGRAHMISTQRIEKLFFLQVLRTVSLFGKTYVREGKLTKEAAAFAAPNLHLNSRKDFVGAPGTVVGAEDYQFANALVQEVIFVHAPRTESGVRAPIYKPIWGPGYSSFTIPESAARAEARTHDNIFADAALFREGGYLTDEFRRQLELLDTRLSTRQLSQELADSSDIGLARHAIAGFMEASGRPESLVEASQAFSRSGVSEVLSANTKGPEFVLVARFLQVLISEPSQIIAVPVRKSVYLGEGTSIRVASVNVKEGKVTLGVTMPDIGPRSEARRIQTPAVAAASKPEIIVQRGGIRITPPRPAVIVGENSLGTQSIRNMTSDELVGYLKRQLSVPDLQKISGKLIGEDLRAEILRVAEHPELILKNRGRLINIINRILDQAPQSLPPARVPGEVLQSHLTLGKAVTQWFLNHEEDFQGAARQIVALVAGAVFQEPLETEITKLNEMLKPESAVPAAFKEAMRGTSLDIPPQLADKAASVLAVFDAGMHVEDLDLQKGPFASIATILKSAGKANAHIIVIDPSMKSDDELQASLKLALDKIQTALGGEKRLRVTRVKSADNLTLALQQARHFLKQNSQLEGARKMSEYNFLGSHYVELFVSNQKSGNSFSEWIRNNSRAETGKVFGVQLGLEDKDAGTLETGSFYVGLLSALGADSQRIASLLKQQTLDSLFQTEMGYQRIVTDVLRSEIRTLIQTIQAAARIALAA